MKTRKGSLSAAIILVTIGIILAVDAGFFLYNPDRFTLSSPFGVLDIIRGNVLVLKNDALTWEKADDGMILESGSRIKTAADADAVITFTRGTTTKLEPGTDLIIDKIEDSQGTQPYAVVLKQQSGKTWNQVDKAEGKASFQIRTTSADIIVHGTLFSTEVDETGKTTVQTTEGKVGVSAGGAEVQVAAGKMTEVKPHEQPSAPMSIPQARNELVITVNQPALGLIKNPSGASIGYLRSGAKVNQISGSSVSAIGESGQTIRIREPEAGEYTLTLRGITDGTGQISVEGIIGGKSAFLRLESCNITAAKDMLLKLHYNVIDGLLQRMDASDQGIATGKVALASVLNEPATDVKSTKIQPAPADTNKTPGALSKKETSSDQGFTGFDSNKYGQLTRWVSIGCFLFLIGVIFMIMRRKS
ncbi:MAG: FecR domain-containing protein [bacterium]